MQETSGNFLANRHLLYYLPPRPKVQTSSATNSRSNPPQYAHSTHHLSTFTLLEFALLDHCDSCSGPPMFSPSYHSFLAPPLAAKEDLDRGKYCRPRE
jgi:hypothetical protein